MKSLPLLFIFLLTSCASMQASSERALKTQLDAGHQYNEILKLLIENDRGATEVIVMNGMQIVPIEGIDPEKATLTLSVPREYRDPRMFQYQAQGSSLDRFLSFAERLTPWVAGAYVFNSAMDNRAPAAAPPSPSVPSFGSPILPASAP